MTLWHRSFRLLSTGIAIDTDVLELAEQLALYTLPYPDSATVDLRYRAKIDPPRVFRVDTSAELPPMTAAGASPQPVEPAPYFQGREPSDLLPFLELEWFREAAKRARERWVLHAAAVSLKKRALILSGRSGAGKTTLTFALLHAGARYLTDEIAALTPTQVFGIPRLLHPTSATQDLPAPYRRMCTRFTNREGTRIEAPCFVPPPEVVVSGGLCFDVLVHLVYSGPGPTRVCPLTSAEALDRFWGQTLTPSPDALKVALRVLATKRSVELSSGTVEGALQAIQAL